MKTEKLCVEGAGIVCRAGSLTVCVKLCEEACEAAAQREPWGGSLRIMECP